MGINKLNTIIKEMTEAAGIQGKINHSGRKTLVQKLQDNDIPPNQIVQITGHKKITISEQLQFSPREADGKHLTHSIFNIKNDVNDYYEYYV